MSKKCELTGKIPLAGNNVSHANNKSKRRFLPNLKKVTFKSDLIKLEPTNPAPPVTIMRFFILNIPGNLLLFRVLRQSTIGAERLDCRVRYGIGYYTFAIITRQHLIHKCYSVVNIKINYIESLNFKKTILLDL